MGALGLTALWFLAPKASEQFSEEGVVEIVHGNADGACGFTFQREGGGAGNIAHLFRFFKNPLDRVR